MGLRAQNVDKLYVTERLHEDQKYFRLTSTKFTQEKQPPIAVEAHEIARISDQHAQTFSAKSFLNFNEILMIENSRKVLEMNKSGLRMVRLACTKEMKKNVKIS